MITVSKPYFIQTKDWSDFWLQSLDSNHQKHIINHKHADIEFCAIIYQYPWHLGQSFFYIPKGPVFVISGDISKAQILVQYQIFLQKIIALAEEKNIAFIKLDFDYQFTDLFDIADNTDLLQFISGNTKKRSIISQKTVQYLSTMLLDCQSLKYDKSLVNFVETNKDFWSKTNENVRRYTRKSLKQNWKIDTSKSKQNFEHFWSVYESTAKRQSFAIHPKSYFEKLFKQDFVRVIVLSDEKNEPHCCWFGISLQGTLYYLYGGNDDYSFAHQGQYLAHVVALQIASKEQIACYDLGGYDSEKGFGRFKEGYRGKIVGFLGPIDIILKVNRYSTMNIFLKTAKAIKSLLP
jgi:lipid II:glycine glycyltransferase (peptidoglycan interpeptide bridge formation enzyme)